jgi:hypothetical protein
VKPRFAIAAFAAALSVAAIPLLAHHSFTAEYDASKPVTIKGKLIKMDWVNPHSWVHLSVTAPDGKVEEWAAETPPPNGLYRSGWRKDMLKEGDEITVQGFLAKDGSHTMWSQSVTFANGQRLGLGTAPGAATDAPKSK